VARMQVVSVCLSLVKAECPVGIVRTQMRVANGLHGAAIRLRAVSAEREAEERDQVVTTGAKKAIAEVLPAAADVAKNEIRAVKLYRP
jgi:cell shape-determining protein MreC